MWEINQSIREIISSFKDVVFYDPIKSIKFKNQFKIKGDDI